MQSQTNQHLLQLIFCSKNIFNMNIYSINTWAPRLAGPVDAQGISNNTKWYLSVDLESMRLNICHAWISISIRTHKLYDTAIKELLGACWLYYQCGHCVCTMRFECVAKSYWMEVLEHHICNSIPVYYSQPLQCI